MPRNWLRESPFGEGMVHLWHETDPEQTAVDLAPADEVPETGWKQVLEGAEETGQSGNDHKLRTVLWGWIGATLGTEERLDGIDRTLSGLEGELGRILAKLLTAC